MVPTIYSFIGFHIAVGEIWQPARVINVRVGDAPGLSVSVYASKNFLPGITNRKYDKICITISSEDVPSVLDSTLEYGSGGWKRKNRIPDIAKNIDSLIFTNGGQRMVINNQKDIVAYLRKGNCGFVGRMLIIESK